jgi:hypothetical protein
VAFVLVYVVLGAIDAWLFVRAARLRLDHADHGDEATGGAETAGLVY